MIERGYYAGLDVGTRTLGLARAQKGASQARPLTVLPREGVARDVARLHRLFDGWDQHVEAVVVGLAVQLDGQEGRSAKLGRQVAEALEARGYTVHLQDERFSTVEASRRLAARGLDVRQQKELIDAAAAAVILEDWLAARAPRQGPLGVRGAP
jgi:putative Holliday junction resolvase